MYFTEIDHLFLLTADLDRSCEEWKRLGFNMSERGYHNDALGTANHLAIFNDTYFEILGVLKHRPSNELYRTFLEAGDGLRGIAFRPNDDLDKIVQRRRRASIATKDAITYERLVPEYGPDAIARFTSVMELADPMITDAMNFACKHHTPQYVWSESKNCHANGVENLSGIWIVSSNVSAVVEAYKDICSATIYRHENGVHIFDVEHLQLRISDRDQCWFDCSDTCEDNATSVAMIEFAVHDLNTTRSYFGANGIEWREYDSSSLVGIKLSEGPVLHYRQQTDDHTSKVKQ